MTVIRLVSEAESETALRSWAAELKVNAKTVELLFKEGFTSMEARSDTHQETADESSGTTSAPGSGVGRRGNQEQRGTELGRHHGHVRGWTSRATDTAMETCTNA